MIFIYFCQYVYGFYRHLPEVPMAAFVSAKTQKFSNFDQSLVANGFVAQNGLRLDFPLPRADLTYSHCSRNAKCSEAI